MRLLYSRIKSTIVANKQAKNAEKQLKWKWDGEEKFQVQVGREDTTQKAAKANLTMHDFLSF